MELEQLKEANEKLTARLNKAVEVFKDMKAQIDALTNENNSLKEELVKSQNGQSQVSIIEGNAEEWEAKYNDLQKQYSEVLQTTKDLKTENENLQVKFTEQQNELTKVSNYLTTSEEELESVKDKYTKVYNDYTEQENLIENYKLQISEAKAKFKDLDNHYTELKNLHEVELQAKEAEYIELQKVYDGDLKRYNELEDNYEGLQNKYKELENEKNNLVERAKNAIQVKDDEIKDLMNQVEEGKKAVVNISDMVQEKETEYNQLLIKYNELSEKSMDKVAYDKMVGNILNLVSSSFEQYKSDLFSQVQDAMVLDVPSNKVETKVEEAQQPEQPKPIQKPIIPQKTDMFSIVGQPRSLQI